MSLRRSGLKTDPNRSAAILLESFHSMKKTSANASEMGQVAFMYVPIHTSIVLMHC